TIYFGAGTCLFAVNPDGTLKWRKPIANHYVDSAPAIDQEGRIYVGSAWMISGYARGYLHAFGIGPLEADADGPYYGLINQPVQFKGSASGGYSPFTNWNWSFGDNTYSDEQNPVHVYINPGNYTVILTVTDNTSNTSSDTTFAWIQETNSPPVKPMINGPIKGVYGISYDYKFKTIDPDGTDVLWYYVDWGDGRNTGWIGPYSSYEEVTQSHFWYEKGTYTIKCKAKDPYNAESDWGTLAVTMPKNKIATNTLFLRFLERFPFLSRLLFLL
ncbi:MAG: PKD domain-containing protein, partial [Thermoplasmatota archaeon]